MELDSVEVKPITSFTGKYRFLSNFAYGLVNYDGICYPSVEHAYQAMKTVSQYQRLKFSNGGMRAGEAKRAGRNLKLRHDWEAVKLGIMEDLLRRKFRIPEYKTALLATRSAELIEGNHWGDTFWGKYNGVGLNHLGLLLMKIRSELLSESLENPNAPLR